MSTIPQMPLAPGREQEGVRKEAMTTRTRVGLGVQLALVLIALSVAAMTLPSGGLDENPVTTAMLLVLAAWVGSRSIRIRRLKVEVTAGDAFMFCGLVAVGPMAALLIALSGILGAVIAKRRPGKSFQALFNVATVALAAASAAHAYLLTASYSTDPRAVSGFGLVAAVAVFGLVNTALVALAIRLRRATKSYVAIWRGFGPWALVSTLASMLIGVGLVTLMGALGTAGPVLGLAGAAAIGTSIEAFRDRFEKQPVPPLASSPSSS